MRLRLATFNVALARASAGALNAELAAGSPQARAVAAVVRRCRPDVLVLNELDHDCTGEALERLRRDYLASADGGPQPPIDYPHTFAGPVNTGVPSGHDLDGDGDTTGPVDALGFGRFPGHYGMALLSRHPIDAGAVRTFQRFPWARLPGARLPRGMDGAGWYPPELAARLPLSSKSHWDVPVIVGGERVHCLVSHPTPPVFDGAERRNRLRNRDEIRFWSRYLDGDPALIDDAGNGGGLPPEALGAILGDLNADPQDGEADRAAIRALLGHPRLRDPAPVSPGAPIWHRAQAVPATGDPARLTGWFGAFGLRLDYVLPDRRLPIAASGVFWPAPGTAGAEWIGSPSGQLASDHRLVWVDVALPDQ